MLPKINRKLPPSAVSQPYPPLSKLNQWNHAIWSCDHDISKIPGIWHLAMLASYKPGHLLPTSFTYTTILVILYLHVGESTHILFCSYTCENLILVTLFARTLVYISKWINFLLKLNLNPLISNASLAWQMSIIYQKS